MEFKFPKTFFDINVKFEETKAAPLLSESREASQSVSLMDLNSEEIAAVLDVSADPEECGKEHIHSIDAMESGLNYAPKKASSDSCEVINVSKNENRVNVSSETRVNHSYPPDLPSTKVDNTVGFESRANKLFRMDSFGINHAEILMKEIGSPNYATSKDNLPEVHESKRLSLKSPNPLNSETESCPVYDMEPMEIAKHVKCNEVYHSEEDEGLSDDEDSIIEHFSESSFRVEREIDTSDAEGDFEEEEYDERRDNNIDDDITEADFSQVEENLVNKRKRSIEEYEIEDEVITKSIKEITIAEKNGVFACQSSENIDLDHCSRSNEFQEVTTRNSCDNDDKAARIEVTNVADKENNEDCNGNAEGIRSGTILVDDIEIGDEDCDDILSLDDTDAEFDSLRSSEESYGERNDELSDNSAECLSRPASAPKSADNVMESDVASSDDEAYDDRSFDDGNVGSIADEIAAAENDVQDDGFEDSEVDDQRSITDVFSMEIGYEKDVEMDTLVDLHRIKKHSENPIVQEYQKAKNFLENVVLEEDEVIFNAALDRSPSIELKSVELGDGRRCNDRRRMEDSSDSVFINVSDYDSDEIPDYGGEAQEQRRHSSAANSPRSISEASTSKSKTDDRVTTTFVFGQQQEKQQKQQKHQKQSPSKV